MSTTTALDAAASPDDSTAPEPSARELRFTVRGKGGKTRRVAVDHSTLELLGNPGPTTASVVTGTPTDAPRRQP